MFTLSKLFRKSMKTSLQFWAAVLIASAAAAGCASKPSSATDRPPRKYINLPPETGSMIPRRVAVSADGATNVVPSNVQTASPESFGEAQRRGSVNRGTGN
jgi:hypothetical protein